MKRDYYVVQMLVNGVSFWTEAMLLRDAEKLIDTITQNDWGVFPQIIWHEER